MSPTALKVTLQAIRRAATLTLDEVLDQDFRVGSRFLAHPDLAEGIRAMIIDKDRRPRWNPATLDEVTETRSKSSSPLLGSHCRVGRAGRGRRAERLANSTRSKSCRFAVVIAVRRRRRRHCRAAGMATSAMLSIPTSRPSSTTGSSACGMLGDLQHARRRRRSGPGRWSTGRLRITEPTDVVAGIETGGDTPLDDVPIGQHPQELAARHRSPGSTPGPDARIRGRPRRSCRAGRCSRAGAP